MKDIQDGQVRVDPNVCVNLPDVEAQQYLLSEGDILLNRTNSPDLVGKSGIFRGGQKAVFASYLVRLKLDTERIDPDFAIQVLNSEFGQRRMKQIATRAISQANINPSVFKQHFDIPLPSPEQQRTIRDVLMTWDAAIEKTTNLIVAKEQQFRFTRQNLLLNHVRLNRFHGEWKITTLRDVLVERGEHSTGTEKVYSVSVHRGLINQIEHLGRSFAARDTSNYWLVKPGDIIYTKSPTGDFPFGIVKQSKLQSDVIVSPLYGVFTPNKRSYGAFLAYYFESPANARNYLNPIIQKGAKNTIAITNATFLSNTILLPTSADELQAIVELLDLKAAEIRLLREQVGFYRSQKRGLLQRLFSGDWHICDGEEGVKL